MSKHFVSIRDLNTLRVVVLEVADEGWVDVLVTALGKSQTKIDVIVVYPDGEKLLVIDGHAE